MKTIDHLFSRSRIFYNAILLFGLFCFLSNSAVFGQAPTISYSTPQTYIAGGAYVTLSPTSSGVAAQAYSSTATAAGSGFNTPGGLAIDAAGNIYVADRLNNQIKKIPVGGGAIVIMGAGFNQPNDVKVDATGNVYVADMGNNAIKEILANNGTTITLATGFNVPSAIALDPAGNIYVADTQNNTVKKVPAGGGTAVNLGFTFNKPNCIATDAAGDLYIADFNFNLYRIPAAGGAPVLWSSGFNNEKGITVDASGIVYVADSGSGFIKRIPPAGGTPINVGPALSLPAGVVVDASGNVYAAWNNASLARIKPVGGYFISAPLPAGLAFSNASGAILGTPTAASVATVYKITAYNSAGGKIASLNLKVNLAALPSISYAGPQTYTTGTAISSLSPTATGVANPAYTNTPVTLATGFNSPEGVAVDAAGNVYVSDGGNNVVKKIAVGGTVTTIGSGFVSPRAVAVDPSNNVYVADWGNESVKKLTGGTGTPTVIGSGFSQPYGLAVDASKNVYVADIGNKTIKKIPLGTGTTVTIGSGFVNPTNVAVDATGNVYVDDTNGSLVEKIPAAGGSPSIISSGLTSPYGVAVDGAKNLYVADRSNNTVSVLAAGSGFPSSIGSGFIFPAGVAVDSKGDIFVADGGNNTVKEIKPAGGYYISPGLPAGLIFNSATGAISGTPTVASAAKNYTITCYSSGGPRSATLSITINAPVLPNISYATPQTYYVNRAITPLAPTSSGVNATQAYTTTPVNVGSGYNGPAGVAVDAAGNVYMADVSNNVVKKIPAAGGTPVVIGSGFSFPRDVAVDAAGNIFVTDFGHGLVKEIPGGTGAPVTIGSGFTFPWGIAIDAAGNLYVSDVSSNSVKKIPLTSGTYGTPVTLASGFNSPYGVAVDAAGNVYVADSNNSSVKKIAPGGVVTSVGSGFGSVWGVRLDGAGNLYVTDRSYNVIKELRAGTTVPDTVASGFNSPEGIALDGTAVIYVADYNNNLVKKFKPVGGYYINPSLPAGLNFATGTGILSGTPTAASPVTTYKVTAYNTAGGKTAGINIKVIVPSSDANLSHLTISSGTLSPVFSAATTSYTATVAGTVSSLTLTATANNAFATIQINALTVTSGTASPAFGLQPGANSFTIVVTAQDGTVKEYMVTVTRAQSTNANLSALSLSAGTLSPAFATNTTAYTANVTNATSQITVTPTTSDATATITVNGFAVASGTASGPIGLGIGSNVITTVVTAQDGTTTKTYTVTVNRPLSNVTTLSSLSLSAGILSPAFAAGTTSYTASVANNITSVTVTPLSTEPDATVKVNGAAVARGNNSAAIPLNVGANVISIVVTAQNGTSTETYTVTVTRAGSSNAKLFSLTTNAGVLTPSFNNTVTSYTKSVANSITSIVFTPTAVDPAATITINGTPNASGSASPALPLADGSNVFNIEVTATNGTTTITYTITVTRAAGPLNVVYEAVGVERPIDSPQLADGVNVHQGLTPNGDGINDFLLIDGIANYPDNKLQIMNRNGQLIFEAKNYDNSSKVFDGHSSKNGALQNPGTYFYSLEYTVKGEVKHKTGFIVLKY